MIGPCFRCLADAALPITVRSREYQATSPRVRRAGGTPYPSRTGSTCPRVRATPSRLRFPTRSCAVRIAQGLCAVCGRDLNREPHEHEEADADPRWAALSELRGQAVGVDRTHRADPSLRDMSGV